MAHGTNKAFLYSAHMFYETFSPICKNMVIPTDRIFFFYFGATGPVGQGLLIHEVSRSHTTTHHNR